MEIVIKIFVSIVSLILIVIFGALAFAAPMDKNKNEKVEQVKQSIIFFSAVFVALYYIWTF